MKNILLIFYIPAILVFEVNGCYRNNTNDDVVSLDAIKMDILSPYPSFNHFNDVTRTHRYVRDCQPKEHGSMTHESITPRNLTDEVNVQYFRREGNKAGHHVVIKNPAKLISVQEPSNGGCETLSTSSVAETAHAHGCYVASNAGFFFPDKNKTIPYGTCYGNIISEGKVVQKTGIQNANFGIRRDGTVVIGYLSEDEVTDQSNPFVQLVTGVGWILRNGTNYLKESKKAECKDTQTTGGLDTFFTVVSARTVLGVDDNGHVHLIHVDGKTNKRGLNLAEAVEFLLELGVKNAINFDGGGSSTMVVNSTVINYPSDVDGMTGIIIPRKVSTILCVKNLYKQSAPEHMASLSYCCNRNYFLIIGLTVLIGLSCLLHVHFYTLYQHHRKKVKDIVTGQQKKEALQSLLQQANNELSSEYDDSELDDM